MAEEYPDYEDNTKSGYDFGISSRPRVAQFEIDDEVKMKVTYKDDDSEEITVCRHFKIRASQRNARGHWEYQLNDRFTGAHYKSNDWFSESHLGLL
ncbi:hypothetical protein P153DRAFT_120730 [Dothidotthia symphoricarpi CBS 119687]|uniref:Uncharacterized protein n=1 Tax=Dothidotthia symphoricarpi CBS 119687 TaxID=1392245 RepID=A0A6A6A1R0_9PLEO|nr:uncharacterized protein P153DRAFT_120730 [Dothidotthia symphoricarpi CBS 119687]KAF2125113.1 hypothetical protein P153DRAFT_120730 [Dothidotthia symphoricarpi CBS 119687]